MTEVLLNDANPGVRVKAIDLLATHKDRSIVGPLQNAMQKEDNSYVRMRMTNALRDMNASLGTF
jgi:HEAT repeat protein